MNKREIRQILNLNNKFYQSVSKQFSKTRQKAWEGWEEVRKIVRDMSMSRERKDRKIKILDLGCGNGRFLDYIQKEVSNFEYVGVDINNDFINEAKEKHLKQNTSAKFINKDIFNDIGEIKDKYDLVVAFGVTHHIPDTNFRTKWFSYLPKLLLSGGVLVLTFWDFSENSGDYLVGWDNKKDTARYCYKYSSKEIEDLISMYDGTGLELLKDYISDNKNRYLIFGKI